jgi:hypothetical protein
MKVLGNRASIACLLIGLAGLLSSCQSDRKQLVQNPPSATTGACCNLTTGACALLTSEQCAAASYSHQYKGNNTVCSPNPCPQQPPESDYSASQQVTTSGSATLHTVSGAGLQIPAYAVPNTAGGAAGRATFSIERDQTVVPVLPTGAQKISDVYRFGPEDLTLAQMVKVTVPLLSAPPAGKALLLYRYNETTHKSEAFGAQYDSSAHTLSAETYHLSPWYGGWSDRPSTAWGAFHITNASTNHWLNLCVTNVVLRYPEADSSFTRELASSSWAPVGEIGWTNEGNWFLPQGTYTLCAEMATEGTLSTPPGAPSHITITGLQISSPWFYDNPVVSTVSPFTGPTSDWTAGRCDCTPVPTPPVGTGQVQVTLIWHSEQSIDLDLYVTEPDSETCYYGNPTTATGGQLDIDNRCSNYLNGRPENIFWTSNAPIGTYKVHVNWFSDCGNTIASMPFDVRIVNGSSTRTYSMTALPDATTEVATFTVTSAKSGREGIFFGPPLGTHEPAPAGPRKD